MNLSLSEIEYVIGCLVVSNLLILGSYYSCIYFKWRNSNYTPIIDF